MIPHATRFQPTLAAMLLSAAFFCTSALAAEESMTAAIRNPLRLPAASAAAGNAIRLSPGPHLFIDDYLIAESQGLARTMHQPEKLPEPVLRKAGSWHLQPQWFMKVDRDPKSGLFRTWYNIKNPGGAPYICYAYAESKDGIAWERRNLGLVEVGGSKENNLIAAPLGHFGLFFVDDGPTSADPSKRYKMAYYGEGLCVAFSAGGQPVPGFDWSDGHPIQGDSVAHQVRWRGDTARLLGETVRLEFSLREGELYGFEVVER